MGTAFAELETCSLPQRRMDGGVDNASGQQYTQEEWNSWNRGNWPEKIADAIMEVVSSEPGQDPQAGAQLAVQPIYQCRNRGWWADYDEENSAIIHAAIAQKCDQPFPIVLRQLVEHKPEWKWEVSVKTMTQTNLTTNSDRKIRIKPSTGGAVAQNNQAKPRIKRRKMDQPLGETGTV